MTFRITVGKLKRKNKRIVLGWDKDGSYYDTIIGVKDEKIVWEKRKIGYDLHKMSDETLICFYGLKCIEEKE